MVVPRGQTPKEKRRITKKTKPKITATHMVAARRYSKARRVNKEPKRDITSLVSSLMNKPRRKATKAELDSQRWKARERRNTQ